MKMNIVTPIYTESNNSITRHGGYDGRKEKNMKTLHDLRAYAENKGMSERDIERLIDEVETDGNGNIIDDFKAICFGIDCETE